MKTLDLVQIIVWSGHLCRLDDDDPLRVVSLLGIGAAPASYLRGVGRMVPTPVGASRAEVAVVEGRFRSLTLTFAAPGITRHDLEDALGRGMPLRRPRPLAEHQVGYRVVVPDAPFSCDVVAWFDARPQPGSVTTRVMLRRRPGCTAADPPPTAARAASRGPAAAPGR